MAITNFIQDIKACNEIKTFRATVPGFQKQRYALPWWKAVFPTIFFANKFPNNGLITAREIKETLSVSGLEYGFAFGPLLLKAIDQQAPSPIAREYSKVLPIVADITGLRYDIVTDDDDVPRFGFQYSQPRTARAALFEQYPETRPMFKLIERVTNDAATLNYILDQANSLITD